MEYSWGHHRRFNAYAQYFKNTFGSRVQKVTIDAGFTCPNRDGLVGTGGCTYCNNEAFNPSYCTPEKSVNQQINEGIEFHKNRYRRAEKFLAYFQAYSNTYKPLQELIAIYDQALATDNIAGIVIGTRPDCIDEEKLAYFAQLSEKYYVIIEYGIESANNQTLKTINRGHTFEQAAQAVELTKQYGIKTGAHFIFGLPGETPDDMLNQRDIVSQLPLDTIKFHQLQIVKDTFMAHDFAQNPSIYHQFELAEYIAFITRYLEGLNPAFVIERFSGEVPPRFLAGPGWGLIRADQVLQKIEKRLEEQNTWQGKYFTR